MQSRRHVPDGWPDRPGTPPSRDLTATPFARRLLQAGCLTRRYGEPARGDIQPVARPEREPLQAKVPIGQLRLAKLLRLRHAARAPFPGTLHIHALRSRGRRHAGLSVPERFERRDPLAGERKKLLLQRRPVVGHELGAVACAADLDVEHLLIGEVRVVRLDRRDHRVHRSSLERMHGRGPGAVDVAELQIAGVHIEHAPVLEPEGDPPVVHCRHVGGLTVHEPEACIVPGPADAVARAKLHPFDLVDLDDASDAELVSLLHPWVRVDNLASRALAMAVRRLAGTWEQRHGCRPVLCETFVDPTRHDGASYRAANWEKIGMTAGYRGKNRTKPPKEILVMALDPDFRRVLKGESRPPKRSKLLSPVCDGPFVAMWMKIIDAAGELAAAHDREWMRRRRVLNSLIVMLFVFRLVLSRGTKGYATVVAELWDQCRKLGIALPQHQPVVASSICKARARVHEDLFLDLHREILRHGDDGGRWKDHRTFAIDGTKMNLPRPLAETGYPLANANAHYPQGLVSCLYRLETKTPVDFSLSANADERAAARAHLDALSPGDVVVVDRGYFSFVLLHAMVSRGLHPVFRLQRNSAAVFDDFIDGDRNDALVRVVPKEDALRKLRAAFPGKRFDPVELRLIKCTAGENEYTLATTLADRECYTRSDLSDLYHGRWGIEELYKTSKTMIAVDEFHGRTERGVRQELYAHFNLIAMTRLLSNRGDGLLEELREEGSQRQTTNFKNALAMMAANLEEMVLARAAALAGTVAWMAERILAVRSRLRPGRSYPRQSMKPRSKWIRMARVTA